MTDLQSFILNSIKEEDEKIDENIVKEFLFSLESKEKYPIDIEKLVEWQVDTQKCHAVTRLLKHCSLDIEFSRTFEKTLKGSQGGRPAIRYKISLECFKSLCLLAQNERGKQIRNYFLVIERLFKKYSEMEFNRYKTQLKQLCQEKEQIEIEKDKIEQEYIRANEEINQLHEEKQLIQEDKKQIQQEKDQIIHQHEHTIRSKDKQLYALRRRHKTIESELQTVKAGLYIVSDALQDLCDKDCKRPLQYKVGIDTVNIAKRLDQHRTTIPALRIDYLVYLRMSDCELLEKCLLRRYEENRFPYINHEWIFEIPLSNIINSVKHIIEYLKMEHEYELKIDGYNKETNYCLELKFEDEKDEHEILNEKIQNVVQEVKEQRKDQEDIKRQLDEIYKQMTEFRAIERDISTYKLKELRENLEKFGLNNAGTKLTIFGRLKSYVEEKIQNLINQVPETVNISVSELNINPDVPSSIYFKKCSKCLQELLKTEFYVCTRSKDGYRQRCKKCFDVRVKGTGKCIDCNTDITKRATRCKRCNAIRTSNRQCPNKPPKEELQKMLESDFQKNIAEKLGVHRSTIIQWKKEYGL